MPSRIDLLAAAIAGQLAPDARVTAERLRDQLTRPVRLAIVGRPGSGKSGLARMLTAGPLLVGVSLVQVTVTGDVSDTGEFATTVPLADIVLWCGQRFDTADRVLWGQIPNAVKDHSFLVLTKADLLAANGLLQPNMTALQNLLTDDFQALFPLAVLQAIAALEQDDMTALRASGAAALQSAIQREIAAGQRAVQDCVDLFLRRHPAQTSLAISKVLPWQEAHVFLEQKTQQLQQIAMSHPQDKVAAILDHCCQTADALALLIPDRQPAVLDPLVADIMMLADTVVLMRIEDSPAAAADALDLILQIRREVAGRLTS